MSRILFLAAARSGLGHVRRLTNIARHLAGQGIDLELGLNAEPAGLEAGERAFFSTVHRCERASMAELAKARSADLVVADTLELPKLAGFAGKRALVLRETPLERQPRFRLADGEIWDLTIVPNPEDHWFPDSELIGSHATESVGWIYRQARSLPPLGRWPVLLVATGGGGDDEAAATLHRTIWPWLSGLLRTDGPPIDMVQAMSPRSDPSRRLPEPVRQIDPGPRLQDLFAAAQLVVSTAGYNSVLELACCTTPAVVYPIGRSFDDQAARAALWGPRLGCHFDPTDTAALTRWCLETLCRRGRRPVVDLGPSGAPRAAELLASLVA